MRISSTPLILGLLTIGAVGCANYAPVANLHRQNQMYLGRIETQLSLDPDQRKKFAAMSTATPEAREKFLQDGREGRAALYRKEFGSPRGAANHALAKAAIAETDVKLRTSDEQTRTKLLNAQLAQIQEEFFEESQADALRASDLSALYLKLVEAVRALHANGVDIQRYLELGRLERAWTDVQGMDPEKLKAIGGDLKGIADRLRR